MYQKLMHNKSLRLIGGLLGGLLLSVAINVFIVPQGLYGGGAYGLCRAAAYVGYCAILDIFRR